MFANYQSTMGKSSEGSGFGVWTERKCFWTQGNLDYGFWRNLGQLFLKTYIIHILFFPQIDQVSLTLKEMTSSSLKQLFEPQSFEKNQARLLIFSIFEGVRTNSSKRRINGPTLMQTWLLRSILPLGSGQGMNMRIIRKRDRINNKKCNIVQFFANGKQAKVRNKSRQARIISFKGLVVPGSCFERGIGNQIEFFERPVSL